MLTSADTVVARTEHATGPAVAKTIPRAVQVRYALVLVTFGVALATIRVLFTHVIRDAIVPLAPPASFALWDIYRFNRRRPWR